MCRNFDFRIGGRSVALAHIKLERKKLYGWTEMRTTTERGGTAFQPVIDYYCLVKKYDGLIIITDGWADKPTLPHNFKGYILWMLYGDNAYKSSNRYTLNDYTKWIVTFPRSRYLILPSIGSK